MFAISGAAPVFSLEYPLNKPRRNQVGPDWLYDDDVIRITTKPQTDTANKEVRVDAPTISLTTGAS
jgi:hypothetical protein